MSIGGITSDYPAGYEGKRATRRAAGNRFDNTDLVGNGQIKKPADTTRQTSVLDIYNNMRKFGGNRSKAAETNSILSQSHAIGGAAEIDEHEIQMSSEMKEFQPEQAADQESETKTEIIVKSDGSRVLVMTMSVGGMETTVSLEISKPTKAPNDNSRQDTDNHMPAAENDTVSDEMTDISNND